MINRLIQPDTGKIYLNEEDITSKDKVELRRHIGYVIQQIGLFPNMTVAQNISVVPTLLKYSREECDRIVRELLDMVNLPYEQYAHKYPSEMSGGQQQRVGVARALVVDPEIIFADEPTGNLDSNTSREVMELMQQVVHEKQQTLVMVTHDNHLASFADRIFHIIDGKIVRIDDMTGKSKEEREKEEKKREEEASI